MNEKILIEAMEEVRRICALGHKARIVAGIKNKQPLKSMKIKSKKLLELIEKMEN